MSALNLQKEMEASDAGLRFVLAEQHVVTMATGQIKRAWALTIERERLTRSGRLGKPLYITALIGNEGDSPAELLRVAATLYEQGDTEVVR